MSSKQGRDSATGRYLKTDRQTQPLFARVRADLYALVQEEATARKVRVADVVEEALAALLGDPVAEQKAGGIRFKL